MESPMAYILLAFVYILTVGLMGFSHTMTRKSGIVNWTVATSTTMLVILSTITQDAIVFIACMVFVILLTLCGSALVSMIHGERHDNDDLFIRKHLFMDKRFRYAVIGDACLYIVAITCSMVVAFICNDSGNADDAQAQISFFEFLICVLLVVIAFCCAIIRGNIMYLITADPEEFSDAGMFAGTKTPFASFMEVIIRITGSMWQSLLFSVKMYFTKSE